VLADDLMWATRLTDLVRRSGAYALPVRTLDALEAALPEVGRVVVDLTARAYDGLAAIALAHDAGRPVLAVGQHDDADLRRAARSAGADRVIPYRLMFEDGPRQLAAWLGVSKGAVSPATRALARLGLLREVPHAGREAWFRIDRDAWLEVARFDLQRLRGMYEVAEEGVALLADAPAERSERVREMRDLHAWILDRLPRLLDEWIEHRASRTPSP